MSKNVDVMLVFLYPEDAVGINEATVEPPLGLGYLAAVTENKGLKCEIVDAYMLHLKMNEVLGLIKKSKPKIVGLSVNLFTYQTALRTTKAIKKRFPKITMVVGGPTPSSAPKRMLEVCPVDAVCIGEGEVTWAEVLDRYKNGQHLFKGVAGMMYRQGRRIFQNPPREYIKEIDNILFPAYHLYPNLNLYKSRAIKKPAAPLLTSRGCPFQCVYCSQDVFRHICRMRSPENVLAEIDMLVNKYGVKQVDILDDNFTMNKARVEKILDLLIERDYDLHINLQSGVRIDGLDQNIFNKMRRAKVFKIPFGVESGDPEILQRIKKRLDLKRLLACTKMAKKAGMKVYGFFMIGLPGDTPKSMQKTIDFAIRMEPNIATFAVTIPFQGTELYDQVKREGKFLVNLDEGINEGYYANRAFYELEGMDRDEVVRYYKKAMRDFYLRPKKIWELISGMKSWTELQWLIHTVRSVLKCYKLSDLLSPGPVGASS
ncbi:MAG: radical SAM protein [Microgenomates group bacterium]